MTFPTDPPSSRTTTPTPPTYQRSTKVPANHSQVSPTHAPPDPSQSRADHPAVPLSMRFNFLRSTLTAWVCLLGLALFAVTTLADSSSLSGNAVSARGSKQPAFNSVDDGTVNLYKPKSVDDGSLLHVARHAQVEKPTGSVDDGTLLTKQSNNAHEDSEIRTLLTTGVDVQAAKRIIDTKTRGLGQVSCARTRQQ